MDTPSCLIIWHKPFIQFHGYESVTLCLPDPLILLIPVHIHQPVFYKSRMQIASSLVLASGDACVIRNTPFRSIYYIYTARCWRYCRHSE
jgi:hypothetical protein